MPGNDELIQALSAALESAPGNVPVRKHLADLLMEAGRYTEAEREYRVALDYAPYDAPIKLRLAEAYYRQHKAQVAVMILEELMRGPNPAAQVFLLAASAYVESGAPDLAARAYQKAVALDPALADPTLEQQLPAVPPETPGDSPPRRRPEELVFVAVDDAGMTPVADIERPQVAFNDVGGMEKLKEDIRIKIIYPLTHPQLYKAYGKTAGGGILMYGPPGCGKTHIARATAGEVRANFMPIGLHDVLDMYIGQSERNLHKLFEQARRIAPCVLFFDEVDALGSSRTDLRHYSAMRHVINQFLSEMDGVDTSNEGVLILAATNAPWYVDTALRRPGRFDRVIFVPPPDAAAREAILRIMLAEKPAKAIDYHRLGQETKGFSGADLKGLVDSAIELKLQDAMRRGVPAPLVTQDLLAALKEARPTIKEWFATARNYALYSNEGGLYDDVLEFLKLPEGRSL